MKLTHAVIIALSVALAVVSALFWASGERRKAERAETSAEIARLTADLRLSQFGVSACSSAIARQNRSVEKMRIDTVLIEKRVEQIVTKYAHIRDTVKYLIEREASCEEQMEYLDALTRRFLAR
jgi:septal ring factor EnvC (AmiA/AmiB activator)